MNEGAKLERVAQGRKTLLIAGDSHVIALGVPVTVQAGEYYTTELDGEGGDVLGLVGTWPRSFGDYWGAALRHSAGRTLAVFPGGNQHLAHFLFAPSPMFDLVVSDRPELELDELAQLVPEAALRAFFETSMKPIRGALGNLRVAADALFVGGTPPPKEDDEFIRARLRKEQHFRRLAAGLGLEPEQVPLSPPVLRLKLWHVLQGVLRDAAQDAGAGFVPSPRSAQTPEGFLKRELYAADVTHANTQYGKLMLEELRKATGIPRTMIES